MGVQAASNQLFYDFCLDDHVPSDLLRSIWPVEKARHDLNGCMRINLDGFRMPPASSLAARKSPSRLVSGRV